MEQLSSSFSLSTLNSMKLPFLILSMFELRYVSRHADRGRALLWRLGPEVVVVVLVVVLIEVVEKEAAVLPAAEAAESPSDVVVAVVRCCC